MKRIGGGPRPGVAHGSKFTPAARAIILEKIAQAYSFTAACNAANIGTTTLQDWRKRDPEFDKQVLDAVERGTDLMEDELRRRALEGVEEGVYYQGVRVDTQVKYSDRLMELAVKARRPHKYRERTELTGADGGPIQQQITSLELVFVAPKPRAVEAE